MFTLGVQPQRTFLHSASQHFVLPRETPWPSGCNTGLHPNHGIQIKEFTMAAISSSSNRLSSSAHQARGAALESKFRSQGMSESDIKTKLASLNNGKAKGADGKESAATGTVNSSSTSSSSTTTDSDSVKKALASVFESLLKAAGIDSSKIKEVLGTLNNGKALGADASSSSSNSTGYSNQDSFEV
jgi:hypothetical protein